MPCSAGSAAFWRQKRWASSTAHCTRCISSTLIRAMRTSCRSMRSCATSRTLLELEVAVLHELRPLLHVALDGARQCFRRAASDLDAEGGEALAHVGLLKRAVDLAV